MLQYCMDSDTSDKTLFPTFARTRPPDTQISKSVAAVLKAFNWTQVSQQSLPSYQLYTYTQINGKTIR